MKSKFLLAFFICAIILMACLRQASGSSGSVVLALAPQSTSVNINETFDVAIQVQAGVQQVDGAAAYLNFDPLRVEVLSMTPGGALNSVLQSEFDNSVGQVNFAAGSLSTSATGSFTLATITFRAIGGTSGTPLAFSDTLTRQSDVTFGGNSVLGSTQDGQVIVSDPQPTTTQQINLEVGWNFKALAVEPATSYTAPQACDQIATQGGNLPEIDRWHHAGWEGHLCDQPFNEFDLQVGSGYFMRANQASTWTIEGLTITTPISFTLQQGWNAISLPYHGETAESLCDDLINQGVSAVEIDRWHDSGWQGHICGLPFNDFQIQPGSGYFIKSTSAGTVTLTEPTVGR